MAAIQVRMGMDPRMVIKKSQVSYKEQRRKLGAGLVENQTVTAEVATK